MIIGITGKSGSGKSYLSEILANKFNALHLDIDKISHEVLSYPESQQFIKQEFDEELFENNVLNRKKLGKIVFCNKKLLKKLNDFCQVKIENRLDEIIKETKQDIILDYALLFLLKQFDKCDILVLLKADTNIRLKRVCERENISKDYFLSRDASISDIPESGYDFVYNNIKDNQIHELIEYINAKRSNND